MKALELAKKHGAKVFFDPGAYNIVASERVFYELLDMCDVVSLNVNEGKALTQKTNCRDMLREIGQRVHLVVLKCGEKGSLISYNVSIVETKGYSVKCVDTTGAGDAFASALIYGMTHQLPLALTGKLANWFAAQLTRKVGARSFPSKLEIKRFLRKFRIQNDGN